MALKTAYEGATDVVSAGTEVDLTDDISEQDNDETDQDGSDDEINIENHNEDENTDENTTGVSGSQFKRVQGLELYLGVKLVGAKAMNLGDYNDYRGWDLPVNEGESTKGFIIQYRDGYISWSPEKQFNEANRLSTALTFGHAIEALKKGYKIARASWNVKDMFVFLVPGSTFKVNRIPLLGIYAEGTEINYSAHMDIRKVDGSIGTWAPSNSDALAEDWAIIE